MIQVYGRPDSSAVARVMWCLAELGLEVDRLDWGGAFGGNDDPAYRAINPAGKIPAIRLSDGRSLWESNAIIRYLCSTDIDQRFVSQDPFIRAQMEAWMDWSTSFQNAVSALRKTYKPKTATQADIDAAILKNRPVFDILDRQLTENAYVCGEAISVGDFALGVWAHRLWRCPDAAKPGGLEALWAWVSRLQERPAYQQEVMAKVSAGPQSIGGG